MMQNLTGQHFALIALVIVCVCGFAYALLYSRIQSEQRVDDRLNKINNREKIAADRLKANDTARRKRSIEEVVNEHESARAAKKKKRTLQQRLTQAGLSTTPQTFYLACVVCAFIFAALAFVAGLEPLYYLLFALVGGLGFPNWFLGFLAKRRMKKFIDEFPNAIEVVVRGIKSGLPLVDCMRMVATEAREPLASEFKQVIEAQQLGEPMDVAVGRLYNSIPCSETSFFSIVIAIQAKSGGSLSEALGNLARVLRERKKMVEKIKAYSAEAKASALIVGSLPFVVTGLIQLVNPGYLGPLFNTQTGQFMLLIAGGLMITGVVVMRNMINFKV